MIMVAYKGSTHTVRRGYASYVHVHENFGSFNTGVKEGYQAQTSLGTCKYVYQTL